jgi:hypothetical protein
MLFLIIEAFDENSKGVYQRFHLHRTGPVDFHQMTVSPADPKTIYGSHGGSRSVVMQDEHGISLDQRLTRGRIGPLPRDHGPFDRNSYIQF